MILFSTAGDGKGFAGGRAPGRDGTAAGRSAQHQLPEGETGSHTARRAHGERKGDTDFDDYVIIMT